MLVAQNTSRNKSIPSPKGFQGNRQKALSYDSDSSDTSREGSRTRGGKGVSPARSTSRSSHRSSKGVTFVPNRNTSPIPNLSTAGEETLRTSIAEKKDAASVNSDSTGNTSSHTPHKSGHKRLGRHMSEIIKVEDAPPLPYNLKSKKRAARRVQSIHHLVERTPSEKELLFGEIQPKSSSGGGGGESTGDESSSSQIPFVVNVPDTHTKHNISIGTSTFDDDLTITNSMSSNEGRRGGGSGDDNASHGSNGSRKSITRTKTMLIPCRLANNSTPVGILPNVANTTGGLGSGSGGSGLNITTGSPGGNDEPLDLSLYIHSLSLREQTRLTILISSQEAQYGFNMFEALIPGDKFEINRLMKLGYKYDECVLKIFEKRYVTKPDEYIGMYANVDLLNHPNNAYYSAPNSPNISQDYSLPGNANERPNYSADYAYTMPAPPLGSPHSHYSSHHSSPGSSYGSPSGPGVPPPPYHQASPNSQSGYYSPYRQSSPQLPPTTSPSHAQSQYSMSYSPSSSASYTMPTSPQLLHSAQSMPAISPTSPSYHAGGVASLPPRIPHMYSSSPAPTSLINGGGNNANVNAISGGGLPGRQGRSPHPMPGGNVNYSNSRTSSFPNPNSSHTSPYYSRDPSPMVSSHPLLLLSLS